MQTLIVCAAATLLTASAAFAQDTVPPPAPEPVIEQSDPDVRIDPLQPDFTLVALPTTLRVPQGKWGFRVTHRFTRPLGQGDVGDLLSDFFGFDSGGLIGLELRYGLRRGTQVGIHRTSDRSIQLFGQHNVLNERDDRPIGLDVLATLEGADNLSEHHRSALGLLMSKSLRRAGAVYVEPLMVLNANPDTTGDNHTFMVGLGTRLRVTRASYFVAEITPRIAGFDPGAHQISLAFEGRAGGHAFQLNVSNGLGTTLGQLAAGAIDYENWYIGFNISRKFF